MNKQQTLNVSLLPVLLLVGLALGAGYFLMKDDFDLGKIFKNEPQVRRLEGFPTIVSTNDIIDKQRAVIKSQAELDTFLKTVDPGGTLKLTEEVNFDREYLIGASTKTLTNAGNEIKVRKLYEDQENDELLVSLKQSVPGEECVTAQQLNIPVDLVAISKTEKNISFEVVKEIVSDCNDLVKQ